MNRKRVFRIDRLALYGFIGLLVIACSELVLEYLYCNITIGRW